VKRTASLMLLFYVVMVLGCTSSQDPRIIGKWVCKTTGDKMELSKGHSCTMDSMGFHYSGRWRVSKSDVTIEADRIGLKGKFDGKNLVLEDAIMHYQYIFEKIVETKS
jgi:hypothetical protein